MTTPYQPVPRLTGVRYEVPLREGGSLPAIVSADDGRAWVVKFAGAGQGPKALIAEFISAGLARLLDLPVPDTAVIDLAETFSKAEPDPEIQDILRGSVGPNFGLAYLSGAAGFDASADRSLLSPELAASIVWFDAFITNVDRTIRNPNLLAWRNRLWLIDHGASLFFHHRWEGWRSRTGSPFAAVQNHLLLPYAAPIRQVANALAARLNPSAFAAIAADIPEPWLVPEPEFADTAVHRSAYAEYLTARLEQRAVWEAEAESARVARAGAR